MKFFLYKMKLFALALTQCFSYSFSQNLVHNPNFEDTMQCNIWNSISWPTLPCTHWYMSFSSSDYFSSSYTEWCGSTPLYKNFGYQLPRSGTAYCGFGTYVVHPLEEYREFLGGKLTDTLKAGHLYHVSFYTSAANDVQFYTDRIGIFFSKDSVYIDTTYYFNIFPQIENIPGNILKDTVNWVLISGYFVAQGGEEYFSLGNFASKANTQVDSTYNPTAYHPAAYYYIDDVSVIDCTAIALNELPELQINAWYNAIDKAIKINTTENNLSFSLINMMGKVVMQDNLVQNEISAAALSRGVYMLVVEDKRYRRRVFKVGVY